MSEAIIKFFVIGQVPGTHMYLSFFGVLIAVCIGIALYFTSAFAMRVIVTILQIQIQKIQHLRSLRIKKNSPTAAFK